jgi:uncharacterized membrane protein YtjA (UPF0391 family)
MPDDDPQEQQQCQPQQLTPLDQFARVFDAINIARQYGFSSTAATAAAAEVLFDLNRDQLLLVASVLAGLIGAELQPTGGLGMDWWTEAYSFLIACSEPQ